MFALQPLSRHVSTRLAFTSAITSAQSHILGYRSLHTTTPSFFLDYHHDTLQSVATNLLQGERKENVSEAERAKKAYYYVRDGIRYDPYTFIDFMDGKDKYKASNVITNHRDGAFCHLKSISFAAVCRALGLNSKVGLCLVKNHLDTTTLRKALGTNEYFHGYASVQVDGRWLKVSPTFDAALCHKFKVKPLEFDGKEDATFHEYDTTGRKHMEYIKDYGLYDDFPFEMYMKKIKEYHGNASVEMLREARRAKKDKFAQKAAA